MHLGTFMRPISIHTSACRYPGDTPDANFNWPLIKRLAQKLEATSPCPTNCRRAMPATLPARN
jgi:hypothetical protein